MASTRPNSDRLLRLKPSASITANVPTIATGTAISGMSVARHDCKNASTTIATKMMASRSALEDFVNRFMDERRRIVHDGVFDIWRKAALELLHPRSHAGRRIERVRAGLLKNRQADRWLTVEIARRVFIFGAQLNTANYFAFFTFGRTSLTRSRNRVNLPSLPVLTTMLPNCCGSTNRPSVLSVY